MIPWKLVATAQVPDSEQEISLHKRGNEFSIRVAGNELMNSRVHGSEEALAELACACLQEIGEPRVLVGGLGMGYTLAAVLAHLGADSRVVVAELIPAVVDWNHGPLSEFAGSPLQDERVTVREVDVALVLQAEKRAYHAILLDVDNGPDGLSRSANNWLYSKAGLQAAHQTLRPGGVLAVWSASPDDAFVKHLHEAGFQVAEHVARARGSQGGSRHIIWLATKAG